MTRCLGPIFAVLMLALALVSCRESVAPLAPRKPVYIFGPGCTVYFTFAMTDSISEIVARHFERCPRVVMDSTLAP